MHQRKILSLPARLSASDVQPAASRTGQRTAQPTGRQRVRALATRSHPSTNRPGGVRATRVEDKGQHKGQPRGAPKHAPIDVPLSMPADNRNSRDSHRRTTASIPATSDPGVQTVPVDVRLNKRMADLGLCSRREADEWIARQWVRVNGELAQIGQRVSLHDDITVQRTARQQQAKQVTILLHKPVGYVSGQPEDGYPSAASLIQSASHWSGDRNGQRFHPQQLRGLAPAGRLDIDSTGLLVLTQNGLIARQIIGENSHIEKEYLVRVQYQPPGQENIVSHNIQAIFPAHKLQLLRHGLSLDGKALLPAQVDWQNPEQLKFILHEGKKRQIRRMCEAVGLKVVGLKRVRIGRVKLGQLPMGQWRYLGDGEGFEGSARHMQ